MTVRRNKKGAVKNKDLPTTPFLARVVRSVLSSEKIRPQGEWNIIFVDNREIKRINKQFLDERGPTDVIAFPYEAEPREKKSQPMGDIFISVPVARANAQKFKQSLKVELLRLTIHGVLHILGYDDHDPKKKKIMWSRQEALVSRLSKVKR